MSKLRVVTFAILLLLVVAVGCSSSDQGAIDKAVSATLAAAQPATAVATATVQPATATPTATSTPEPASTPAATRTPVPTATSVPISTATSTPTVTPVPVPVPTTEPTATPIPSPTPTIVPTPEPTATATSIPTATQTSNKNLIVDVASDLVGINDREVDIGGVQVTGYKNLEVWVKWIPDEEWERAQINKRGFLYTLEPHSYANPGQYSIGIWLNDRDTGDVLETYLPVTVTDATIFGPNITEDTVLTKENSPYVLADSGGDQGWIADNASLSIEPGVEIWGGLPRSVDPSKLTIKGTSSDPITFRLDMGYQKFFYARSYEYVNFIGSKLGNLIVFYPAPEVTLNFSNSIFQNGQFVMGNGVSSINSSSFIDAYVWGSFGSEAVAYDGGPWSFLVTEQDTVIGEHEFKNNCLLRSYFPIRPSVYDLQNLSHNQAGSLQRALENPDRFIRNTFIESEVRLVETSNLSIAQVLRIPSNYWGGDPEEQIKHDLITEPSVKISGLDQYGPLIVEYEPQLDAPHPDTPSCGQ